jgi:hypothetical protein
MYKTSFLIGLLFVLGVTGFGQKQKTEPQTVPSEPPASGKSDGKASKSAPAAADSVLNVGTSLEAQLQNTIDVRKSKVGDEIILKTTKAIKQNGETVVPKGTQLIGRITEVQQKTKENAVSKVGMVFDRIQGKNLDAPISASIVSVATTQVNAAAGDVFATGASGSSSTSASGSGSGGGLLGGGTSSAGGLLGGVGSTAGSVLNTTTQTVGNVAGTATNTVGQTTGSVVRTVNGLQISSTVSGSASSASTISAQGKNVHIDKGATFLLRVDGSTQNQE